MFSSFSLGSLPKLPFSWNSSAKAINITKVQVHDVETSTDKRDRRLKHLLKLNHANFSILYNQRRFHNHTPHILGSTYILGGSADHLTEIYEHAAKEGHEHWEDSTGEIAFHDYRDFLGKREYQRAWVDFFEDQLVDHQYDWKQVAARFLFERGPKESSNAYPIFTCLTAGLGHPLIHLGYAYELSSREVGMEALGLAATCYDPSLAALLEENPPSTSLQPSSNLFEIFNKVRTDSRLDPYFPKIGDNNLSRLLSEPQLLEILQEHFNAWQIPEPKSAFEQSQRLAVALLISTSPLSPTNGHGYDFFLLHVLTTSHACRILIPFLPAEYHVTLLREWFLITLALYIAQLRPNLDTAMEAIEGYDTEKKTWDDCRKLALKGEHRFDEHYVKGIRAIQEASKVWTGTDWWFEHACVKFAVEFEEWKGFSESDTEVKRDEKGRVRRGSAGAL